jgi:hypothetical protein
VSGRIGTISRSCAKTVRLTGDLARGGSPGSRQWRPAGASTPSGGGPPCGVPVGRPDAPRGSRRTAVGPRRRPPGRPGHGPSDGPGRAAWRVDRFSQIERFHVRLTFVFPPLRHRFIFSFHSHFGQPIPGCLPISQRPAGGHERRV